ncbi:response regulator [Haloplanus aerogenes]|uniref:Response regulator n=1 Tax=Haloplanus aerogenes TaxID=660522 RepID=A0A3G8QUE6_9EURY|nr:response regulator [Haloplanus aerogenes]
MSLVDDGVDAAILDRRMPGRTGDDVAREIKMSHPTCAVVLVSALQPGEATSTDLECDRYVTKPVRRGDLIGAIEAAASL